MTDDDERIIGLLRGLDDAPVRPGRFELREVLRVGRRRQRVGRTMRAGSVGALAVAVLATAPVLLDLRPAGPTGGVAGTPPATTRPAPTSCTVERLPVPKGFGEFHVSAGDRTGRYLVGGASRGVNRQSRFATLLWDGDRVHQVAFPKGDGYLSGVNSAGVAVGGDPAGVYLYRDGRLVPLPGSTANMLSASINDAGQVVGNRMRDDPVAGYLAQPLIWRSTDRPPVELPLPGAEWSVVTLDLAEDGTVVGILKSDGEVRVAGYLWRPDGSGEFLRRRTADGRAEVSMTPVSVQGGWVTGQTIREGTYPSGPVGARLHLPTGSIEVLAEPVPFRAQIGNGQGWMAGTTSSGAVLLAGDRQAELPDLPGGEPESGFPKALSDDGRTIAGTQRMPKGADETEVPVRWRCH